MSSMDNAFLDNPQVKAVLIELGWGDRFESDLAAKVEGFEIEDSLTFDEIREGLLVRNMVFRLKGDRGSPYLSLTDRGLFVLSQLQREESR